MMSTFHYSRFDRGLYFAVRPRCLFRGSTAVSISRSDRGPLLRPLGVPSSEFVVLRHLLGIGLRVDADMDDGGLAAGVAPLDRRADLVFLLDVLTVAAEAFGDLVEPHILAPVHAWLRRGLFACALVHADFEPPLMVDAHHTHQR